MFRRLLKPMTLVCLCAGAMFAQGALPTRLSAWQAVEVDNAQLIVKDADAEKAQTFEGHLRLGEKDMLKFVAEDGPEVAVPYSAITSLRYERVVLPRPKSTKNPWTWRHKVGREENHTLTVNYKNGRGPESATLQLHKDNYNQVLRLLEAKVGMKASYTAGSVTWQ